MAIGHVRRAVLGFAVAVTALTCVAAVASSYHIVKRIPIAGDTGWDYITADTDGRRLYVPHGVEVIVLDLDTGEAIGKIAGLRDAHGVAVAREVGRGFIDASDPTSKNYAYFKGDGVFFVQAPDDATAAPILSALP